MTRWWSCILTALCSIFKVRQYTCVSTWPSYATRYLCMLCGLLARRWCRRHALQRSPTCLALTGRCLLGKVHALQISTLRAARCTRCTLCFLLCKHIITAELMLCKFSSNTIYCVFYVKNSVFCRFEHNILWLK